jgi:hypothetical protein
VEVLGLTCIFAVVALAGLFAALWPDKYAKYFLAKVQREMTPADLKGLAATGWVLFAFAGFALVALAFPQILLRGKLFDVIVLFVISAAWSWWGFDMMRRPESFRRGSLARLPVWGIKLFGVVLLLGAAGCAYQLIVKAKALVN